MSPPRKAEPPNAKAEPLHATAISINGRGVLLTGPSGSGKSGLAARLIDAHGARLIGDDRVLLTAQDGALLAAPAPSLEGLLELRGLGLLRLPFDGPVALALAVDLVAAADAVPRLPEACFFAHVIDGHIYQLPKLTLYAPDTTTPLTIYHAVTALKDGFNDSAIYDANR